MILWELVPSSEHFGCALVFVLQWGGSVALVSQQFLPVTSLLQPGCLPLSVLAVSVVFCCFVKMNSLPFPTPACLF